VTGRIRETLRKSPALVGLRLLCWKLRFRLLRHSGAWKTAAPDGLPVPPEELRFLISGIPGYPVGDFLEMGRHCFQLIRAMLHRQGVELEDLGAVLDFGCGCGRTLRNFARLEKTRLYGTDYNPVLIKWCRPNLAFARFEVNRLEPPLAYPPETFGLVYAFSVFTHLPEALQHLWIEDFVRILRPGGHLLFSTMPERELPGISATACHRARPLVVASAPNDTP